MSAATFPKDPLYFSRPRLREPLGHRGISNRARRRSSPAIGALNRRSSPSPAPGAPGPLSGVSRAGRGKSSLSDWRNGSCLRVRRISAEPGGTSFPRRPAPSRRQSVRPTPSRPCLDSKLWPPPGDRRKGARTAASGVGSNGLSGKAWGFNSFPSRGQMASPELIFGGSLPHVREAAPSMARGGTLHR